MTDDDLPQIRGDAEQIIGAIQSKTGEAREEIADYLQELSGSAASATGQLVVKPAAMRGVVDALLATAANIAVRQATACVGHGVGRLLGTGTDKSAPPAVGCAADRAGRQSC